MRRPKCSVCRARLDENGKCPFTGSHENILKMRAEQARRDSEKKKQDANPEEMKRLSDKAARVRRAMPKKAKVPKTSRRARAAQKRVAEKPQPLPPRDKRGRFLGRKRRGG